MCRTGLWDFIAKKITRFQSKVVNLAKQEYRIKYLRIQNESKWLISNKLAKDKRSH